MLVVYDVFERHRRGVRNQKIENGGIGGIFQPGDIPLPCEPTADLPFAYYITKVLTHVSGKY
jgi:hypothetical protein